MIANKKTNIPEFTVTDISRYIKQTLESEFSIVRIKGEMGRVSRPTSGHIYFDLKDSKSVIAGIIWRTTRISEPDLVEEGNEVVLIGKISAFAGQSKYQIIVEEIQASGVGALLSMLNKRKEKLEREGLFNDDRKLLLPSFPETIGVITSMSGVVIEDILARIRVRFPVKIIIFPVSVQGENCANEVIEALEFFNLEDLQKKRLKPEIIIVARGGGSFEDLWPFNDENLVRAVAASKLPVISAIGHETDVTLIDLVSDIRAPTPTAAAELAVPEIKSLYEKISYSGSLIKNIFKRSLISKQRGLSEKAGLLKSPEQLLKEMKQRIKFIKFQLSSKIDEKLNRNKTKLYISNKDLKSKHREIENFIFRTKSDLSISENTLTSNILRNLQNHKKKLINLGRLLESVSYRKILSRGYAVVRNQDKKILSKKSDAKIHQNVTIEWYKGKVKAKIVK